MRTEVKRRAFAAKLGDTEHTASIRMFGNVTGGACRSLHRPLRSQTDAYCVVMPRAGSARVDDIDVLACTVANDQHLPRESAAADHSVIGRVNRAGLGERFSYAVRAPAATGSGPDPQTAGPVATDLPVLRSR